MGVEASINRLVSKMDVNCKLTAILCKVMMSQQSEEDKKEFLKEIDKILDS